MEVMASSLAQVLEDEVAWFEKVANASLTNYFANENNRFSIDDHPPPHHSWKTSPYAKLIKDYNLDLAARLVLVLSIIPYIKPQSLDVFLITNQSLNTPFLEFGGEKNANGAGFIPTLETACFVLGGQDLNAKCTFLRTFDADHVLYKKGILTLDNEQGFYLHQKLLVTQEYLGLFTTGKRALPQYNSKFPAKPISTQSEWEDLILNDHVMDDLNEIKDWLLHSETILESWNLKKELKAGYRVLFFGSPGTGKTFAATLLGKETQRPVFRVDLSLVVSKYIGETEKNLGQLFDEAENKDWILFFDEADALFGKRTQTKGANDRYANQEVAYLLQRIEDFSGLVILATNIQTNIDEAFSRRFQSMVHFPKPDKKQRKLLWERLFSSSFELDRDVVFDDLAGAYELSAGEMVNVLRYCALAAAKRNRKWITHKDILKGIQREYHKSNKTL